MAVAACLQSQPSARTGSEIGGHDRRSAAEKCEGVDLHPRIAFWQKFRDSLFALRDQNVDRIGAVRGGCPFRERVEWQLLAPFDTDCAPLFETSMVRRCVHVCIIPNTQSGCNNVCSAEHSEASRSR